MKLTHGRVGIVSDIDPAAFKAKVTFPSENFVTDWLYVERLNGFYSMPKVNETVAVWLDSEYNTGVIMGSFYTKNDPAPFTEENIVGFKLPGVEITIDTKTGNISVSAKEITLKADAIKMDSAKLTLSGDFELDGDLKGKGAIEAMGKISTMTDVETPLVKLNTHTHLSAAPGSATSPPVPM